MAAPTFNGLESVARIAGRLAAPLDPSALEAVASDLLALGDWCAIDIAEDGRRALKPVAFAHADPTQAARARAFRTEHPLAAAPASAALRTDTDADPIARALGWRSWLVAPLAAQGHSVGALTVASSDPGRPIGDTQLAVVRSIATMVGLALSAQRVARERDELLTVVSHDLRNPLGVILLVVDLLRQSAQPAVATQMGRLERSAQSMGRILTDLVDAGRVGASTVPLETEVMAASRVITDACNLVQAAAEQKGVVLERSAAPGLELRGDRARLTRMVEQLVQAAVGRTPPGHRVEVTVEPGEGGGTLWTVVDSAARTPGGLDDSPARRAGAFGWLIARGVIQAHGGALWLERGGEGGACTVVRFALPATPPAR